MTKKKKMSLMILMIILVLFSDTRKSTNFLQNMVLVKFITSKGFTAYNWYYYFFTVFSDALQRDSSHSTSIQYP